MVCAEVESMTRQATRVFQAERKRLYIATALFSFAWLQAVADRRGPNAAWLRRREPPGFGLLAEVRGSPGTRRRWRGSIGIKRASGRRSSGGGGRSRSTSPGAEPSQASSPGQNLRAGVRLAVLVAGLVVRRRGGPEHDVGVLDRFLVLDDVRQVGEEVLEGTVRDATGRPTCRAG